MKNVFVLIGFIIIAITAISLADAHIFGFNISNDTNGNIKIEWRTSYESNVEEFILQRKTDQTDWITIKTFQPQGANSYYSYVDYAAYKTSDVQFYYQIGVKNFNSSQIVFLDQASINQKVSGFKQTWGSIKAMFR